MVSCVPFHRMQPSSRMPRNSPKPSSYSPRQVAGALLFDLPRFLFALRPRWLGGGWERFRNRGERLVPAPGRARGVGCDWAYSRRLHFCRVWPSTARVLLRRGLADYPVERRACPEFSGADGVCANGSPADGSDVQVSFVIGHRGTARLPHLLLTLESIAAQRGVTFECLVVEQSGAAEIRSDLPGWVRYLHQPCLAEMPYARSWAFNAAEAEARGRVLVFHDNDMMVPSAYAAEAWRLYREGYEVVNLKRFIYYLQPGSVDAVRGGSPLDQIGVEAVVENLEAGGSVCITREAYEAIGGFDEDFVGWGGEDNEFWDRCLTRKTWNFGFLPIVHLWHASQPGKRDGLGDESASLYARRHALPPAQRIGELVQRPRGLLDRPPRTGGSPHG